MVIRALFAITLLLASPAAFADGGKEEYEKAVKYSKAGEYEAALPLFKKAYELSGKRPSTIVALAQCERSLKIWDDAIGHFKEYLAVKPTPKDAKKIKETITLLEEIRAQQPKPAPETKVAVVEKEATPKIADAPPKEKPQTQEQPPQRPELTATTPPKVVVERPVEEPETDLTVFWVILGAVAVAGGVAAGFALSGSDDPYGGSSGEVLTK